MIVKIPDHCLSIYFSCWLLTSFQSYQPQNNILTEALCIRNTDMTATLRRSIASEIVWNTFLLIRLP